jgi:DNA-binding beta-propeller fold protein YncE
MTSEMAFPLIQPQPVPPRRGAWRGVLLCVALSGCTSAGPIFPPLESPLAWPQPPAQPRIHYVGQIVSSDDLKPAPSFGEVLFGGGAAHTMLTPYALCTDRQGRLLVADSNGQMVHMYDFARRVYESWEINDDEWRLTQPVGIICDRRERVLVTDSVAGTIFAFDKTGRWLGEFGHRHLIRPAGLAEDPERGRLFVADPGAHCVVVLDDEGRLIRRLGERGTELGQFNYPTNVAVDSQGRLYVSDSLNFRVQLFSPELEPLRQIGRKGDMPGYFGQPKGLAVDQSDHLYVVDAQFEAVQIFDADGALLLAFGSEGTGPGEFWLPAGIHIDQHDRIWITDSYNRRVQVFDYRLEEVP